MNKAIFIFTMKRYLHWVTLLVGSVFVLLLSLATGMLQSIDMPLTKEIARSLLVGPMVPLLVAYTVISPQVANSQRRKDGEYLSLIFSRPISRWSYVITKWLTGSAFVLAVIAIQTALAYGISCIVSKFFGTHPSNVLDGYAITDAIFNAFGFTALVVFISSMPQRIAVAVMLTYVYIVFILTVSVGTASYLESLSLEQVSKVVTAIGQLLFSIFIVGFDSYHVLNASSLPIASALIYFSNVVLYLTLATLIMTYREFFYAND